MLDLMRRKKRLKLILWLVIAALALSMLVFFVPGTNMGGIFDSPGVVASVSGREITAQDFSLLYRRVANNLRTSNKMDAEAIRSMGVPTQVLNELINYEVMEILAKRFGITVTEEEMRRALENDQNLMDGDKFIGIENYKALMAMNGYTAAQYEKDVRRVMLHDKVRDFLTSALRVTDSELRDNYRRTTEKIQLDYVLLKKDDFKKRMKPTSAEIESWFNENKDNYIVHEKRSAEYMLIPYAQFAPLVEITEDDIIKEWNSVSHEELVEAAHILLLVNNASEEEEVKRKAEEVLKMARATSGQDFSKLAKKYSEDPGSAEKGGYLGTFGRGQMVPEFDAAVFALKPGEISNLVRTQYGYHIILSLRHESPTLESSREELDLMARDSKLRSIVLQKAEEAKAAAAKHADINEAVKSLNFTVEIRKTGLWQKDEPKIDPDLSPEILEDIFSLKEIGDLGNPVEHAQGFAVPKLTKVELPHPGTLAEFRQKAEADYIEIKAKDLMDAEAQKLSAEGIKQANLTVAAKALGLSVKTSQEFSRNGTPDQEIGSNQLITNAAFALETGAVSTPQSIKDDVIVFQVKSRSPFDEAAFEKQKIALGAQLLQNRQDTYFREYVNRMRDEMTKSGKISTNQRALTQASLNF